MTVMTQRKKPDQRKGSRHRDRRMVALLNTEYAQLAILAERNDRPLAWELRRIVREALAAQGLWPPPDAKPDDD